MNAKGGDTQPTHRTVPGTEGTSENTRSRERTPGGPDPRFGTITASTDADYVGTWSVAVRDYRKRLTQAQADELKAAWLSEHPSPNADYGDTCPECGSSTVIGCGAIWHDIAARWVCVHCASSWPAQLGADCLTCGESVPQAVRNGAVIASPNDSYGAGS